MMSVTFPSALSVLRHLQPIDLLDPIGMRWYAKAFDFVHRFWPALEAEASVRGAGVTDALYEELKTVRGIRALIAGRTGGLESESLSEYLETLSPDPLEIDAAHKWVLAQVDAAVLAALPAQEVYGRVERAAIEGRKQAELAHQLAEAVDGFARVYLPAVMGSSENPETLQRAWRELAEARQRVALAAWREGESVQGVHSG